MTPIDYKAVGERIHQCREQQNLTLAELARRVSLSSSTIQRYEKGTFDKIKLPVIEALAKALDVNPSWLIGKDEASEHEQPKEIVTQQKALSSDLADLDAQLNANGHIELVNYAEFLVSQPAYRLTSTSRRAVCHYIYPVAAGYASPVEGEDYEMLELDDVPPGADYCITVSGDSMEPYIKDGSIVFVKRNAPLSDFDVGVFYVDGDILIKQFTQDAMRNIYLLSANPKRADANRMIMHNSNSAFMYYGRVITGKLPQPKYI